MYQTEALWIHFAAEYPCAVKIAAGKINAVSGRAWCNRLDPHRQDYLVVPEQPWLDGFAVGNGLIRQFVAMPLGDGYTAEEQLTGQAEQGGIQIVVYPMKREIYRAPEPVASIRDCASICDEMGLAPGGLMRQQLYRDKHGVHAWDQQAGSRCFVHLLSSLKFLSVTGQRPPQKPLAATDYTNAGLPWFEYYDSEREALDGAARLAGLDSVAARSLKRDGRVMENNAPISPEKVVPLGPERPVREGDF